MGVMIGNNALDQVVGDAAIAADLAGMIVRLCQLDIIPDRDTLLATLAAGLADYSGYAQEVVTWSAPTISDDGQIEYQGACGEFRPTSSVITNNIYVWYAVAAVGGALLFCGRFDGAPLPMESVLDNIVITLRWRPRTGGIDAVIS